MDTSHITPPTPLSRALDTIKRLKAQLDSHGAAQPVAIVGVGLRFPGAIDDLESYWQALAEGRDLVRPMPAARKAPFAAQWDKLPHKGGFLDEVTGFDAGFFGISPREARALDPQHRLLLEVAWEALENAALPPDRLSSVRTGLYVGITGQDYRDWQIGAPDAYWATGNGHCFAAGRLAYSMGFTGPALAVDTACSSGLVAVHLASQAIRRGECDVAVAGGVSLVLSPRSTRMVMETRALAPDGLCKTFDARANGYTRGEGCGIVVLKRLDHALRDGDHVHAVIRGSAVNQDGRSSGFTAPNVRAQIALIDAALTDAGLTPADIGLVEAHGTGTALGDPIEMEALVAALGKRNDGATLHVGSVKPNFGHLEAAAGVAGLLKAVACCTRRAIPALVHYRTLNPRIDLAGTGIKLPTSLVPWATGKVGQFAGVSSFGLSGTNAHMIVGAGEAREARAATTATGFELTARTPEALRILAGRFRQGLAKLTEDQYGAFAYTATAGRARQAVRVQIAAADKAEALAALEAVASNTASPAVQFGVSSHPFSDLPRCVVELPHYPWQRETYVPQAASGPAAGTARATSAPLGEHSWLSSVLRPAANEQSQRSTSGWRASRASARREPAAFTVSAAGSPLVAPEPGRLDAIRPQVRRHVAAVLGHRDATAVPEDANLFDLGLDSMMAVDLARTLAAKLGVELSFTQVFSNPSVQALAACIVAALPVAAPAAVAVVTSPAAPAAPAPSRLDRIRLQVRRHVAAVLGHRDATAVPEDANLFDLGLDSMMAVDLARALAAKLAVELSFTQVFSNPSVHALADCIVAALPDAAPASVAAAPPREERRTAATVAAPGSVEADRAPVAAAAPAVYGAESRRTPRVAFVFSCQGSQSFGMGRELYDTEPVFRAQIDACDRILAPLLGASLTDLMMHGDDHEAIHTTRVAQPALVALQLALAALWKSWGVTPSVVLGHSLGEVAAAIYAGALNLEDGLTLVAHRARLMASAPAGAMLAITATLAEVTGWLDGTELDIAAINGPKSIVVSGARDAIEAITARLRADGITARRLIVPLASHARVMEPIVRPFHDAITHLSFHAPSVPLLANLTGRLATAGDLDATYWSRHVREPVRFHDNVLALRGLDIDVCLELGPDATLTNLITAGGLLPAGGGLASLKRGASPRASMLAAADALHAQGQDLAWNQILAVAGPARGATPPDLATADRRRSRAAARSLALLTVTLPLRARRPRVDPQTPQSRALHDGLVRELATALNVTGDLDLTRSVMELGGDSFTALIFRHRVERRYAIKLPLETLATEQPVSVLLDQLAASIAVAEPDTDRTAERRVA